MKIKLIALASDFASTKYTPSHYIIFVASVRAQHYDSHHAFGQAEQKYCGLS
jgi:hypothetical protein